MSLNVAVELDGHTLPVDPAVAETLKGVLIKLGIHEGSFDLHYGLVHKGAKHRPGIKYLDHVGGGMQLTIRPGNHSKCLTSMLVVRRPNTADDIARRFIQHGRFVPFVQTKKKNQRDVRDAEVIPIKRPTQDNISITVDTNLTNEQEASTPEEVRMKKRNFFIQDVFRFHSREVQKTMMTLAELFGTRDVHTRIVTQAIIVTLETQHRLYLKRNTPEEILKGFVDHGHVILDHGTQTARIVVPTQTSATPTELIEEDQQRRLLAVGAIATVISSEIESAQEVLALEKSIAEMNQARSLLEMDLQELVQRTEDMRSRLQVIEVDISHAQHKLDSHPGKPIVEMLRKIRTEITSLEL